MTKLSFIASEARRHLGRMPEQALMALQRALINLCENHWLDIRGPEPASGLARAIWTVNPHCADLVVDLYGCSEPKLTEAIGYLPPTKALAALVLAEIERGDAEGARLAYEAMMLFESPQARDIHTDSVRSRLRGIKTEHGRWHKHAHHDPLFRAVAMISEQIGRSDFQAMIVAIEYLAAIQASPVTRVDDQEALQILEFLRDMDLVFQRVEEGRIHYTVRGESKKPISGKRLEEMLAQIRGNP
ncbi:hypothetical protein [Methylobacter sp. YRD-M1]|uniref:hypothetical protein n=1 Tax=Methylobacter sp. YRD-M1 TaxID=2911520 RepID=UPI00227C02AF|nr:hypothetical protein [Methylobacter sp. YRD-M1]WAK00483.1 hypothetical protein LZ558_11530 [Methylobacter sp. YRD-M1]